MIQSPCVAGETEGPGGREPGDGGRGVAPVARYMSPHGTGVGRSQRLGAMTVGAGAVGVVVLLVTAGTGDGGIDRGHGDRPAVTGFARLLGMPPVGKGNWPLVRRAVRYRNLEPRRQRIGHPGRLVALLAALARPHLVMADLTTAGGLERELLPGPGEMALEAGHLDVAAVGEAVLSRGGRRWGRLRPGRETSREQPDQGGPNEQAPGGVRPPGPAIGRSEVVHGGCRESTSRRMRSARRAPGRPTA
jgi:hypothetical protein